MRDLAQIVYENSGWFLFLPLWLSDCHMYTWRLLPLVMLSNFRVSELSLLEFTALIMAGPTSAQQLKRSEPKIGELMTSPTLPFSPLPGMQWGQRTFPDLCLQKWPCLILHSHPELSCLVHCLYPWFHDSLCLLVKTGPMLSTLCFLHSPHPIPCSLLPSFCSRWRLYHLNLSFTQKLQKRKREIGVNLGHCLGTREG